MSSGAETCVLWLRGATDAQVCKQPGHHPAGEAARGSVPHFLGYSQHKGNADASLLLRASTEHPSLRSHPGPGPWHVVLALPSVTQAAHMGSWHCPASPRQHTWRPGTAQHHPGSTHGVLALPSITQADLVLSAFKWCSICLQSNRCLPTQPASLVTHTSTLPSHYCTKSLNLIALEWNLNLFSCRNNDFYQS